MPDWVGDERIKEFDFIFSFTAQVFDKNVISLKASQYKKKKTWADLIFKTLDSFHFLVPYLVEMSGLDMRICWKSLRNALIVNTVYMCAWKIVQTHTLCSTYTFNRCTTTVFSGV